MSMALKHQAAHRGSSKRKIVGIALLVIAILALVWANSPWLRARWWIRWPVALHKHRDVLTPGRAVISQEYCASIDSTSTPGTVLPCDCIGWRHRWSVSLDSPTYAQGNAILRDLVRAGCPLTLQRLGSGELRTLYDWVFHHPWFPTITLQELWDGAGLFKPTVEVADMWGLISAKAVRSATVVTDWNPIQEMMGDVTWAAKMFSPNAIRVPWMSLMSFNPLDVLMNIDLVEAARARYGEPPGFDESWVHELAGKVVLVVTAHPLSVRRQFDRKDSRAPRFKELKIIQPPMGLYPNVPEGFEDKTWIDALNHLIGQIEGAGEYDFALVSCGAYSVAVMDVFKSPAVYLGGELQTLFGIKGGRWEPWMNQHLEAHPEEAHWWVSPDPSEVPKDCHLRIEGCSYF